MDWIKTFTQERKVKFWKNCETVLFLRLRSSFANHQHAVVSQLCSSHNWLTQIWGFWSQMFIGKQSVSQKCPSGNIQEAEDAVFEKLLLEVW